MPGPKERNLEETGEQLVGWLAKRMPEASELEVGGLGGPATTGFSNDTLLFDVSWKEAGEHKSQGLVARIKPTGYQIFPEYDLSVQYRIMKILGEQTSIPVPRMYWMEEDDSLLGAPFYVMEQVEGRIPTDNPPYHAGGWMHEVEPREREAIWWSGFDTMAELHHLDWRKLGLDFLETDAPGETQLEKQLRFYERFLEWATRSRRNQTVERGMEWLWANRPQEQEPVGLCWGDARIGNMIFRENRCVAVLDWEMATLGNPEQDFAWAFFLDRHHSEGLGLPRLEGFPSREETIARYEQKSGLKVNNFHYYEVFAGVRFGVIMMRLGQQLHHYGLITDDSDFEINNIVTRLLAKLLELPAPGE
jgi:aminoglycoside phosphotransferase (APT) family kinase protein